jgi:hypothetical protein
MCNHIFILSDIKHFKNKKEIKLELKWNCFEPTSLFNFYINKNL